MVRIFVLLLLLLIQHTMVCSQSQLRRVNQITRKVVHKNNGEGDVYYKSDFIRSLGSILTEETEPDIDNNYYDVEEMSYEMSKYGGKGKGGSPTNSPSPSTLYGGKGKGAFLTRYPAISPSLSSSPFYGKGKGKSISNFFDISNCETFETIWLKDLYNSCEIRDGVYHVNNIDDLTNCRCFDAERRIESGEIECGVDLCPDDCDVCKFCYYYVTDCTLFEEPTSSPVATHHMTSEPSLQTSQPTVSSDAPFDISVCETYSTLW